MFIKLYIYIYIYIYIYNISELFDFTLFFLCVHIMFIDGGRMFIISNSMLDFFLVLPAEYQLFEVIFITN